MLVGCLFVNLEASGQVIGIYASYRLKSSNFANRSFAGRRADFFGSASKRNGAFGRRCKSVHWAEQVGLDSYFRMFFEDCVNRGYADQKERI